MTIDDLRIRRRDLRERKKEELRLQAEGNGDNFALFMVNEELLEVNAQLRSLTAGRRIGNRCSSADQHRISVDRQLYKDWAEAQADEDVCSKGDTLREILAGADRLLTEKQVQYLRAWSSGKTMEAIGREYRISKSTVSRTIQRGKERLQKAAELSELIQRHEVVQIDLSDPSVIKTMMKVISPKQAVYLYLYYGEWLTLREIASLMDLRSHQSVMVSIHTAMHKIGQALDVEYAELTNMQELGEIAYTIYTTMEDSELLPQKMREKVEGLSRRKWPYRYVRKDKLPHIAMHQTDTSCANKENIWMPIVPHNKRQRCSGKLLRALLERRKATVDCGGTGWINRWLTAIFQKMKRCVNRKTKCKEKNRPGEGRRRSGENDD